MLGFDTERDLRFQEAKPLSRSALLEAVAPGGSVLKDRLSPAAVYLISRSNSNQVHVLFSAVIYSHFDQVRRIGPCAQLPGSFRLSGETIYLRLAERLSKATHDAW